MKIEKIHLNKIKVTFTPEDLIEHNITPEAVRDNAPSVQEVLMRVVHRAEEEFGFEAQDARLMIEAMPGETGSMVMYITKLTAEDAAKEAVRLARKRSLKVRARAAAESSSCIMFDDFEDAVRLSRFASGEDGGELYFYEGKYYLITDARCAARFSEFGKAISSPAACDRICEHGRIVCYNALATLRSYF